MSGFGPSAILARGWFALAGAFGLAGANSLQLSTQRLQLRPARQSDYVAWARLRRASYAALKRWEPSWSHDHLSEAAFRRRVRWSESEIEAGRSYPFLIFEKDRRVGARLVGGVTIEHVRLGAAMSGSVGYWLGVGATGRGLMTEALLAVVDFAFEDIDITRLEAACLLENDRSRRLLERVGFQEEGRAAAYLCIDGEWRDHVLYELRRDDRTDPRGGALASARRDSAAE